MEWATQVQILDEAVCISLCANALGKKHESIYSSSSQLWVNGKADQVLQFYYGDQCRMKILISNKLHSALKLILSHPAYGGEVR